MRAREFVREDGWGPAQQAAVREGLPIKGPPPAKPSFNMNKVNNLGQAALAIYSGYEEIMALPPTLSTEAKTREITKIISRLSMEFGVGVVGYAIGACLAGAVSGNALVGILGGVGGAILASYYTGDTVGEISEFIAHSLYDQQPQQLPADPRTTQKKMKYPWMNEESASDINPNTGKPYTTDEWDRYWNPGAGRPYTEKEKEMFADPDVTVKSVGKEVLRRIPGIGALINSGDAVTGFKDLSR